MCAVFDSYDHMADSSPYSVNGGGGMSPAGAFSHGTRLEVRGLTSLSLQFVPFQLAGANDMFVCFLENCERFVSYLMPFTTALLCKMDHVYSLLGSQ